MPLNHVPPPALALSANVPSASDLAARVAVSLSMLAWLGVTVTLFWN